MRDSIGHEENRDKMLVNVLILKKAQEGYIFLLYVVEGPRLVLLIFDGSITVNRLSQISDVY